MINEKLNPDSLVLLLLCSDLGLTNFNTKPYTLKQWEILSKKLMASELRRPRAFLDTTPLQWKEALRINDEESERIRTLLLRSGQLAIEVERLQRQGIWITTRAESTYPARYKKLLRNQSPIVLYGAGDVSLLDTKGVAIVGSRDVDDPGVEFTKELARKLANDDLTVISGGSKGVDKNAEESALSSGGKVISVLSDSMETTIRNKDIRNFIINQKLLVLSAYNPKARFRGYTAMERNKHIYTLSDYAVVVSSSLEKGGTWGGATENLKNVWVPLFVRMGSSVPDGNNALIKLGGIPMGEAELTQHSLLKWFEDSKSRLQNMSLDNSNILKKDLFEVIWPYLEKFLYDDRTIQEITNYFQIHQEQAREWLEKATKQGKTKRTTKGYKLQPVERGEVGEQLSLFN